MLWGAIGSNIIRIPPAGPSNGDHDGRSYIGPKEKEEAGMAEDDKQDKTEISLEEQKRILALIVKKWTRPRECPICAANKWFLAGHLTTPTRLSGLSSNMNLKSGPIYPAVSVVCSNCGFIHQFNAVALGVVSRASGSTAVEAKDDGGGRVATAPWPDD
jgi:hypothetical protein